MRHVRRALTLVPALALLSCAESALPTEDSDGSRTWSLTPEPLLTIGQVDGEVPYLFSRIGDVRLLPDGSVVVADRGTLRLYDSQGIFRLQMGGSGEGPGEFQSLSAFLIAPPDTLLAFDARASRLTRFLVTGELVSTQQLATVGGRPELFVGRYSGGDLALAWIRREAGNSETVTPDMMEVGRFTPNGQLAHVMATAPGMRRLGSPLPFSPHFLAVVSADSLVFTDGLAGEIGLLGLEGSPVRTFRVPFEGLSFEEAWEQLEVAIGDSSQIARARQVRERSEAEPIPAFSDMLADDEGQLWLKEYVPATDSHQFLRPRTGGEWRVIDRLGRVLASVTVPEGFRPVEIRRQHVVGISRDDLGVERVIVYGLMRD